MMPADQRPNDAEASFTPSKPIEDESSMKPSMKDELYSLESIETEERRRKSRKSLRFLEKSSRLLQDENENAYGACRLVKQNGSSQTATGLLSRMEAAKQLLV
ncbi:hypothetical protein HAX54_028210 [Datura stramonium]|uniref:Uncharacterized protein n=1 Tax=Datura stramonium TaxID=4076 RepID=A0ABS8V6Y6_DATST|nr:hypothetical protein [Datura stramonium]